MLSQITTMPTDIKQAAFDASLRWTYVDQRLTEAISSDHLVLNKKVQFNDWLFTHLHKLLVDDDFVVELEKK